MASSTTTSDWELSWAQARAWIKLPGESSERLLSVTSVVVNLDLNGIPSAVVNLAVGRRVHDLEINEVHKFIDNLRLLTPIRVEAKIRLLSASAPILAQENWPDGWFVLFEGYAVGVATSADSEHATLGLHCVHWLSDLSFSSAASRSSAPVNPAQFSFGLGLRLPGGSGSFAYWLRPVLGSVSVRQDLWKNALAPWCDFLCSQDRFIIPQMAVRSLKDKNYEALRALLRFEGFSGAGGLAYKHAAPMALDVKEAGASLVAGTIANSLRVVTADSVATATLWDKLAGELAGQYLFSIVPMSRRALVVPFVPGLRQQHVNILPYEYYSVHLETELLRPLRGVGVMSGVGSVGGSVSGGQKDQKVVPFLGVGGWYEASEDAQKSGMTVIRQAPDWLCRIPSPYFNGRGSVSYDAPRGTAASPGVGATVAADDKPAARRGRAKTLWDAYARSLYVVERLRGRRGILQGKFRVDITPGTTVRLTVAKELFVSRQLELMGLDASADLFGHVSRVTLVLDAERRQVSTVLALGHLRTDAENEKDDTSVERHPLYENVFTGAPYVDFATDMAPVR